MTQHQCLSRLFLEHLLLIRDLPLLLSLLVLNLLNLIQAKIVLLQIRLHHQPLVLLNLPLRSLRIQCLRPCNRRGQSDHPAERECRHSATPKHLRYSAPILTEILRYNPSVARLILLALLLTAGLPAADLWTWWVDDCTGPATASGCHKDDAELARWAFEAWQRESGGQIVFQKSTTPQHARLTVHWETGASLYGETRPVTVDGRRGAEIYILPGANATRVTDPLLRATIVFLTFVHETGHALGLSHTSNFADIMYSFQYGGDIDAYFDRYRRLLIARPDIALHSGLSDGDRSALQAVLAR